MLRIVRDAGRETVAPAGKDFEGIGHIPTLELTERNVHASLFLEFACRRRLERLVEPVERAGHRLPEAGSRGTFQQQHLERCRMHHHEDRDRQLVGHASRYRSWISRRRCGSTKTAKNGSPWDAWNSALDARISTSTPKS